MEQPNTRSFLAWNIGSTKDETIEQKTHTNPRDCVKRRCDVLNQPAQAQRFLSADRALSLRISNREDTV